MVAPAVVDVGLSDHSEQAPYQQEHTVTRIDTSCPGDLAHLACREIQSALLAGCQRVDLVRSALG